MSKWSTRIRIGLYTCKISCGVEHILGLLAFSLPVHGLMKVFILTSCTSISQDSPFDMYGCSNGRSQSVWVVKVLWRRIEWWSKQDYFSSDVIVWKHELSGIWKEIIFFIIDVQSNKEWSFSSSLHDTTVCANGKVERFFKGMLRKTNTFHLKWTLTLSKAHCYTPTESLQSLIKNPPVKQWHKVWKHNSLSPMKVLNAVNDCLATVWPRGP